MASASLGTSPLTYFTRVEVVDLMGLNTLLRDHTTWPRLLIGDDSMMRLSVLILCVIMTIAASLMAANNDTAKPFAETAMMTWLDDVDVALSQSKASGRPVLALLNDGPDCASCRSIRHQLSRHPLLTEAVTDEFVALRLNPHDAQRLTTAGSPLIFLNGAGQSLLTSTSHSPANDGLALRMQQALHAANRPVPRYLQALALEDDVSKHKRSAFAMFCYWIGEYELGKIDGVISTEAGWLEGREVTLVNYHEDQLALPTLAEKAAEVKCAQKVFAPTPEERQSLMSAFTRLVVGTLDKRYRKAKPSDQKKQIQRWDLSGVPGLTPMQLTKLNAFAPDDRQLALSWLSPRQRRALMAP